jgi:hypothetical protein
VDDPDAFTSDTPTAALIRQILRGDVAVRDGVAGRQAGWRKVAQTPGERTLRGARATEQTFVHGNCQRQPSSSWCVGSGVVLMQAADARKCASMLD